jgi:hypothetical protein
MALSFAKDSHSAANESYTTKADQDSSGDIGAGEWKYLVWSFELTNDMADTTVTFFIDNAAQSTPETFTDTFIIHHATYLNYIGQERTGNATYGNRFNGFIHDFVVYQKKHEVSVVAHANAGCSSGCWDMTYN